MRTEIEWVVQGIHEGFEGNLSIADFGRMARLSPCHMARLFHQETGLTPSGFLLAVRMEQARRKLLKSQQSIADIADEVGYASLGAFTSRFTKVVGVSPGKYRRISSLGSSIVDMVAGVHETHFTYGSVTGRTRRSDGLLHEPVYIAAFPISAEGRKATRCCRSGNSTDLWNIAHIPSGQWVIEAVSRTVDGGKHDVVVGQSPPLQINPGVAVNIDIVLTSPAKLRAIEPDRAQLGLAVPKLFGC
ncbi:MAG: helix-turn-helix transcriptional regulator [Streptomyces sp.]|nr:helix-turn-helix transcriptional regulator [Streptomyces sp.]